LAVADSRLAGHRGTIAAHDAIEILRFGKTHWGVESRVIYRLG
jgi:hypothetical protein